MKAHFLVPLLRQPDACWHLVNGRTGQAVATRLHTAFESASRREGLLKQAAWPQGAALIIAPCQAVHTVGMKFAIDVVFVDRAGGVVKVRERVRPRRATGALRAFATIELPAGSLDGALRPGDTLALVASE